MSSAAGRASTRRRTKPAAPPLPPSPPPPPADASCLLITGVLDGPRVGGTPKAVELSALCDVADLTRFGLARAPNGGPSQGVTTTLSAGSLLAGGSIYASYEAAEFAAFFAGAPPHTVGGALYVNGNETLALSTRLASYIQTLSIITLALAQG